MNIKNSISGYSLEDAKAGYWDLLLQSDEHVRNGHFRKCDAGNRNIERGLPHSAKGRDYNPWGDGESVVRDRKGA